MSGSELGIVDDEEFILPEQIRCTTPTQVGLALKRPLKQSGTFSEEQINGKDDENQHVSDWQHDDLDPVEQKSHHFPPLDYYIVIPNSMFPFSSDQTTHPNHIPLHPPPIPSAPPSASSFDNLNGEESVVEELLMFDSPLTGHEMRNQKQKQRHELKKSFMVEFTSEEEYEKFLRFKNKLSSSSCCSSPTISLGSPTPQLNDDDDVDDDEAVVVVEDKKGDCPKDGHSVAKTNSLANGNGNAGEENFISSPESSSYLATLTEEDEDVEEEEDDERTANGDGVKLIPHSSQLTQGIDANCYEIKQIASENGTNQLDYLGASADSRQYPHKADDDDFGDDFNDDEELGLPEAEQQHGEKWKKKRNKDEEESAKGGGGWREESSRLKTGECALNSSTADARPMEPSPLKHGSFGGEIRSSDGAEDIRDRLVSDDSGNDDYDDVNHSIEKSATSQDNCFGEFANHQNIPQNPVLSLEKGVQCQESIWARALYDEKSIQVPSVSPQKSSTGSPLTSSDQVEESCSEEAEEIAKGRPGNENLSDGSNRCNSGFVVTESRDCDVVVKGVGRTSVQDYCPTCESDLSDCCSSCCCCSSVLCLNNSEVRSPPCDRARLNESNCCRVVVKREAEELHNNKEGPCENNNSGSGSEDDDEDIVVATADDSNDNLAFFSCCNSPAPLGAGAASPEFPSFSSTCNNSKRTAGNNSTSGSSGGGSSSLNCSLVCDVSGVRSVGGKSETDSDNNGCIEVHVRANINVELSSSVHEKEEAVVVPSAFSRVVGKSARNIGKQVQYSRSDCLEGDLSNNSNSDKDIIIFHDDNKNEEGSDFESGGSDLKRVPFTSSNSSLNSSLSSDIFQNCNSSFEASNRLKRLEERLKKFQYTKKLLRDDRGTTTSNCGNPIRDRDGDDDEEERLLIENISKCLQESYSKNKSSFKRTDESPNLISSPPTTTTTNRSSGLLKGLDLCNNNFQTLLTSATDVIEGIERDRDKDLERKTTLDSNNNRVEQQFVEREEDFKEFFPNSTYFPSDYFALQTSCVFNVDELPTYPTSAPVLECYDELEDDIETEEDDEDGPENSQSDGDDEDTECDCVIEAYPFIGFLDKSVEPRNLIQSIEMRENTGPLRGLLKKPNRPPPQRKNRVVFDETRNEFFDADYIILIREDCPYDEEDEEPCTCGEHELVRLCCEEGCQCPGYTDDCKTPQSPKFAPPIEFVDSATLSPPEGYKDGGALSNVLGGALGGHVFGAQHIQQLQVIQRLQQQRAAMLAARNNSAMASGQPAVVDGGNLKGQATQQQPAGQQQQQPQPQQQQQMSQVCTECAECAECAAKQMQEDDCHSPCPEDVGLAVPHVAIVPIKTSSPERRITSQKEIVAGEERPKYLAIKQLENQASQVAPDGATGLNSTAAAAASASTATPASMAPGVAELQTAGGVGGGVAKVVAAANNLHDPAADPANIAGILKGGKLWKSEQTQCDETTNITSDEEGGNGKRSVRFTEVVNKMSDTERDDSCDGIESDLQNGDESEVRPMEILPMKKQSSLFHNALRPNSAVRQLFPTAIATDTPLLTHESLRAFEDSKRITLSTATVAPIATHSDSETDTIRRTIERNALRRSLIKYEPKKMQKPTQRIETSLEERIRLLTCDIDEPSDDSNKGESLERRDSPAGEENPQQAKYLPDKSYSPSSSASSSSSGSQSAYRKITDIFNKDRRQERILEADENPIVIVPQDCRCPAAPDLGMGVQMPQTHTQVHQTPPRQNESRRQFLSTLAPLTACVAGQRDDMSYYTLAAGDRNSTASSHCSEYSLGDIEAVLHDDESKKVAPDVIAGTPGQETDELAAFAQQEASRTERIKKRYSGDSGITSNSSNSKSSSSINATSGAASDEDDEQNDYGFNKRPSVRGIKPRFGSTNEILQQMQAQLATPGPLKVQTQVPGAVAPAPPPQAQMIQKVQTVVQQQQIATAAGGQHPGQWGYYPLGEHHHPQQLQRTQSTSGVPDGNFYAHLPAHVRHSSFHGHHEEATIYQNCHSVTVEHPVANHPYGHYARSPTRRPESPPPLRNYHQTMVLIPYNTETYAHYATNEHVPVQQIRRLEYQQVTQQTIRVPVGYPISGQMLHVVAGRATPTTATTATTTTNGQLPDYATLPRPRQMSTGNYAYVSGGGVGVGAGVGEKGVENNVKFIERGAPEGAASVQQVDGGKTNVSPSQQPNVIPQQQQQQQQQNPANPGNVFYAMNV